MAKDGPQHMRLDNQCDGQDLVALLAKAKKSKIDVGTKEARVGGLISDP